MQQRAIAGRYEITSPIARGGMGEVWAAYDKRLDRPVAVKLLRPDALPTSIDREALAKRFVRESRLTARVEHAGVPAVFDAGTDQGSLYLVMQLVPGIDLAGFIAERAPLPVGTAAAVAAQIVSVLAAAHAVPAVHRDLKPSNVMIRPDGTVVVLDFGVAALLEADVTKLTDTGEMLGSPACMSPEQVLGAVPSPRSDLYALGCILHEMLTGEPLFSGEGAWAVVRQHMEDEPPPLRSLRSDVPDSLERLVLDLLAKQPEDRPADASTVYDRLYEHLPSPGSGQRLAASGPDPTRPYRRPLAPPPAKAVRAAGPVPEAQPPDVDRVRDEAAELAEAGRLTQAAELLTGALVQAGDRPGPEVRGLRLQLANTLLLGGDYARALREYQVLIADVSGERGADDDDVLAWRVQVAICQAALGNIREALDELVPVLAIQQQRLGGLAPEVIELRRHLALLRASAGDVDQAKTGLQQLMAELGTTHPARPEIGDVLHRLGGS